MSVGIESGPGVSVGVWIDTVNGIRVGADTGIGLDVCVGVGVGIGRTEFGRVESCCRALAWLRINDSSLDSWEVGRF